MKPTNIRLPEEMRERLVLASKKTGLKPAQIIRQAIEAALKAMKL